MHTLGLTKRIVTTSTGLSALALFLSLQACSSSSSSPASSLSISGTASTGAALNGATLEARCSNGTSGSATSSSDGSYTVQIANGVLPCMLRATGTDASGNDITLHSVADVGTTTANVTPLTELIVAAATGTQGGTPSDAFTQFAASSDTRSNLSTQKLTYAKTVVASAVTAAATAGNQTVSLTNVNPLSDSFKVGSDNDKLIDSLVAALKKNASAAKISEVIASLSEGIRAVAQTNPSDATAAASSAASKAQTVVSVPFAIPSCPAARNVRYRIVGSGGGTGLTSVTSFSGNSGTATASWEGDATTETDTFTFDTVNPCKFTLQPSTSGSSPLTGAYASSGAFVVQSSGSGDAGIGIGFPEQTIALSELAGTWNALEFSRDSGWKNFQNLLTLDSAGNFSNVKSCSGTTSADNACVTPTGAPAKLVVNAKGGFDATGGGGHGGRVFAFKSASGNLMLVVALSPLDGGGLIIATPQAALTTHAVNDESKGYYVSASPATTGSALTTSFHSYTFKATASDAASTTWSATFDASTTPDTFVDQWNQPRHGLSFRAPTTKFAGSIGMKIKGIGLTVRVSSGVDVTASPTPFMTLSVTP